MQENRPPKAVAGVAPNRGFAAGNDHPRVGRWANQVLVIAFVGGLYLPVAQMLLGLFPEHKPFENRRLAAAPAQPSGWESLKEFPTEFEQYFDDHFGFRNTFLRWNNLVRVRWLGAAMVTSDTIATKAPTGGGAAIATVRRNSAPANRPGFQSRLLVARGDNGWLYSGGALVKQYYDSRSFTPDQLAGWRTVFEQRQQWLQARGIRYLLVFCPVKASIYPQHMRTPPPHADEPSGLDKMLEELVSNSSIDFVDLRAAVLVPQVELRTYHRTDTHWNEYGAYLGYREIISALQQWFEVADAWPLTAFDIDHRDVAGGDLARMMGLSEDLREESIDLVPLNARQAAPPVPPWSGLVRYRAQMAVGSFPWDSRHPDESLPSAVVCHDSFGFNLIPFLAEHFSEVVFYHSPSFTFTSSAIEERRPQVVIDITVDRRLANPPVRNSDEVVDELLDGSAVPE